MLWYPFGASVNSSTLTSLVKCVLGGSPLSQAELKDCVVVVVRAIFVLCFSFKESEWKDSVLTASCGVSTVLSVVWILFCDVAKVSHIKVYGAVTFLPLLEIVIKQFSCG